MKKYSIYVYQNKNNCVLIARDIVDFIEWCIKKVNEPLKNQIKDLLQYERKIEEIKSDNMCLFLWVNQLSKWLDSSKYEVSISMEL